MLPSLDDYLKAARPPTVIVAEKQNGRLTGNFKEVPKSTVPISERDPNRKIFNSRADYSKASLDQLYRDQGRCPPAG